MRLLLAIAVGVDPCRLVAQEAPPREQAPPPVLRQVQPVPETPPPVDIRTTTTIGDWLSKVHVDLGCPSCPGDTNGPPVNPNAPWALQSKVRFSGAFGTVAAGVIGVRNDAAPLYSSMPIAGDYRARVINTTTPNFFVPATQWHLTAAFERALLTTSRGKTFSFATDLTVPLRTTPRIGDGPGIDPLSSTALRVGFKFRW